MFGGHTIFLNPELRWKQCSVVFIWTSDLAVNDAHSPVYLSQAKYNAMAKYTLPKYYLAKYTLTWVLVKVQ